MTKEYNGTKTPLEHRDSWETPKFVFDHYDKRFEFSIDMAASADNFLCYPFIDQEMNALSMDTVEEVINSAEGSELSKVSIWCNPPYSDIMPWVEQCVEVSSKFKVPVVVLVPADTSVKWFKFAYEKCTECHFISGRLAFINAETKKPSSGKNKGSVVFIFDPMSPVKKSVHLIDRDSMS